MTPLPRRSSRRRSTVSYAEPSDAVNEDAGIDPAIPLGSEVKKVRS